MNSQGAAQTLSSEVRTNISKLVYFLFSMTTVSFGYAIQSTKGMTLNWSFWNLWVWCFSLIGMAASFAFGIFYIFIVNRQINIMSSFIGWRDHVLSLSILNNPTAKSHLDETIKNSLMLYHSTNPSKPDGSVLEVLWHGMYEELFAEAQKQEADFNQYIMSLSIDYLRIWMQKYPYKIFKLENEPKAFSLWAEEGKRSDRYLLYQLISLCAAYILFAVFHMSMFN